MMEDYLLTIFSRLQLFYILKKGKDSVSSKELCGLVKGGDCAEYSKVRAVTPTSFLAPHDKALIHVILVIPTHKAFFDCRL